MRKDRLLVLLEKYKNKELLPAEWSELTEAALNNQELENLIQQDLFARLGKENPISESALDQALDRVLAIDKPVASDTHPIHRMYFLRKWGWAVASVILLIAATVFLIVSSERSATSDKSIAANTEIPPGQEGAILTLADGSQITLDSLGNGLVASQNGVKALLQNGLLSYHALDTPSDTVIYNTITTPRGRQFHVQLQDGTNVWLNAASSIRYPTVFAGKERTVEITGEAFFEVVKNTKKPFRVNVNNKMEVEVLGTEFNVNAYDNEEMLNVTLINGSVKVNSAIINPGQQAQVGNVRDRLNYETNAKKEMLVIKNVDIDKVLAWRNDLIYFDGATFEEIMRKVERWYDIKVEYKKNKVPQVRLAGKMTRDVSLNGLLEQLKGMGVNYELKDRTLIVSP